MCSASTPSTSPTSPKPRRPPAGSSKKGGAESEAVPSGDLADLLDSLRLGDYLAIQAYLEPTAGHDAALQRVRMVLRDRLRVATTVGYGPRYLHSTGQLHKGGPPTGVFVQVVDEHREVDLAVPGWPVTPGGIPAPSGTFGALLDAQALGDLRALRAQGRRVTRITLSQLEAAVRT